MKVNFRVDSLNKNLGAQIKTEWETNMRTCRECGEGNLMYPAHCHTTDVNVAGYLEYTCCVCLGHGVGASGDCVRLEAEREALSQVRLLSPHMNVKFDLGS